MEEVMTFTGHWFYNASHLFRKKIGFVVDSKQNILIFRTNSRTKVFCQLTL